MCEGGLFDLFKYVVSKERCPETATHVAAQIGNVAGNRGDIEADLLPPRIAGAAHKRLV